ncbi:SDR family NAD(P)-dependent oxidoreductase [Tardiphaga sp. vice278]|uniref:SDR family NAD(P)-dependent oxidoreductase n=1 Tax=Tardiphaga sp. vice278 TaxID=2592815 RepID=UPI001165C7FA|nr:SDR family NAD(P)-dependent oxidoreductase [Tardiphaga sp. vice278]QDM17988.1 SDR family NAD(P)-dependent oxidoreductase [Tardiphaga sp. vice278]
MSQRVLILGATSAIAHAYARRKAAEGASLVLAGRRADALQANAVDLRARGAAQVDVVEADLADIASIAEVAASCRANGAFQEVLLAYGILGDQAQAETDLALARKVIDVNFTSAALWLLELLKGQPATQPLTLLVIGSVAGDRGRKSNFVYGSAKGGLERFVEGLQHARAATATRIVLIKPGFVDTPMTDGIAGKGGPLWASADKVAGDIAKAAKSGTPEVYTPWFWWFIMAIIRNVPRVIFHRTNI